MDNVAEIRIYCNSYFDSKNDLIAKYYEINASYPAASTTSCVYTTLAEYGQNEVKCVKQFEAFKKALLAGEKFFDFSKEVE